MKKILNFKLFNFLEKNFFNFFMDFKRISILVVSFVFFFYKTSLFITFFPEYLLNGFRFPLSESTYE